ncbi:response regulator [Halocynthiibacter sp. C4]|uniref:response regulator n=1 Tax=Halocynthiibacter sp. C4 TaxID=2992758 RepID=UPI00237C16B2|nr:response regulator [Halocynthiibacter sp. C4]MDE0589045.1 response regulator [Halocynthiibacter sp. C4]
MAKILIVDDEPNMREMMEVMLKQAGHHPISCANATEALTCQSEEGVIDAAILDIWLGSESGLDLCDALRGNAPDLPVIFVSGGGGAMSMEITTALADLKGRNHFLYKPFKKEDLLEALDASF